MKRNEQESPPTSLGHMTSKKLEKNGNGNENGMQNNTETCLEGDTAIMRIARFLQEVGSCYCQ